MNWNIKKIELSIALSMDKGLCSTHFYKSLQRYFEAPVPCFSKVITVKLELDLEHHKISDLVDLKSDTSKIVGKNFKSCTAMILRRDLSLSSDSDLFDISMKGLQYTPYSGNVDKSFAEFILHIESRENNIPICYADVYTDESDKLRSDLTNGFQKILAQQFPSSNCLQVICTGFWYSSIHLRFKVILDDSAEWSNVQRNSLNEILKNFVENNLSPIGKILSTHGLDQCFATAKICDLEAKGGLIAMIEVELIDKTISNEQMQLVLPEVEKILSSIKVEDIVKELEMEQLIPLICRVCYILGLSI